MRYAKRRVYSWSPNIAYSVGLIASDGCLSKDGRHIDLTSVDVEQLENFSSALGRQFSISIKQNGSGQQAFRIQFSDVAYYDFLLETGLTPTKSKTIDTLRIPAKMYPDFLRGLFDGDGTTFAYIDARWKSSYMFYMQFATASLNFAKYIQLTNQKLFGTTAGSIRLAKRAYILSYAKKDSHKLHRHLYYHTKVLCLSRKQVLLRAFIEKDQPAIIAR